MPQEGYIEIIVDGKQGQFPLTPDTYDIKDLIEVLHTVEGLVFGSLKNQRPTMSYSVLEGSVRHRFKTTFQSALTFAAILAQVQQSNSLDDLEATTAKAFEIFQISAQKKNVEYRINSSANQSATVVINPTTALIRSKELWANAEFYFYGTIVDAGGKGKANIHLDTQEYGLLKIATNKSMLSELELNPLYKQYGVRATGMQNLATREIDKTTLLLIEIIDYHPAFDEQYLQSLIEKGTKSWEGVEDPDTWLQQLRGNYEV
ncbi:MAG: hypothetical protein IPM61_09870 [Chlorobi bacterium]|nr:MAG: hypothetical protein UZ07_CHB004000502 [Chlorobi bacterium OLB7]MBK8911621.1 hypothetical protein [Chlorobiota bacterium]MBX7215688.1 hypothetical protein [Candidatus Kapabacteria bacterium]MCE7933557.1 hypothetical protein [Chlorobi bacterium CHB2]